MNWRAVSRTVTEPVVPVYSVLVVALGKKCLLKNKYEMQFTACIPTVIKLLEATMFLYFRLPVDVHTPAVISGGLHKLLCLYSYCTFLRHFCNCFLPAGLEVFLVFVGS